MMTVTQSLVAFLLAAGLLTITPGLDTALVLRTAAVEGARSALQAALGIVTGCLVWGAAVAFGLGVLLMASQLAFTVLKWAGAAYLLWLGVQLLLKPRAAFVVENPGGQGRAPPAPGRWLGRGLLTNLLNPKVGVFYVSFLPQFVPAGVSAGPYLFLLTVLHALMGILWFGLLVAALRPITGLLKQSGVIRALDGLTGLVFIAFGLKLAVTRR
jgi:threonine/homoserine/homoserine lactone efflux protein